MKKRCFLFLSLIFTLSLLMMVTACMAEETKETIKIKEVIGKVAYLSPKNNPKFITIAVDEENADYQFVIDERIQVTHKKNLGEINIGDTVRAVYQEIELVKEGKKQGRQVVKEIVFLKAGVKKEALSESESGVLVSGEE